MTFQRTIIVAITGFIFTSLTWSFSSSLNAHAANDAHAVHTNNSNSTRQAQTEKTLQNNTHATSHQKSAELINQVMTEIGNVTIILFPLIYSEKYLSQTLTPQQNKKIYILVGQLKSLLKKAEPHILTMSLTYQMSYQLFLDYLDNILIKDNPAFLHEIQNHLSILSDFCVSCHTQDSEFRTLFDNKHGNQNPLFESNLTNAEFNYSTRNYLEAHKYYEKYLLTTPNLKDSEILKNLTRIVSIYTQILNKPSDAIDALKKVEKEKGFSPGISKYIRESKQALSELHTAKAEEKNIVSFKELKNYVDQYLGNTSMDQGVIFSNYGELIEKTWLRGLLFRFLNNQPKQDQIPYILYWLALCNLSLGNDYDNILADYYIKQCITRYSNHPFAQHCFKEHKSYVRFYYTTPTEAILPFEINDELNRLERFLRKK